MSQAGGQFQFCDRLLRAEGRRLCLCGGGTGPPCGPCPSCICVGRALTGDPKDTCGGLFRPFADIGKSFRIEFSLLAITAYDVLFPLNSNARYQNNAVAQAFVAFDVCQLTASPWWEIRNYAGIGSIGGSANAAHTFGPPPPIVLFGPVNGVYYFDTSMAAFRRDISSGVVCNGGAPPYGNDDAWCALAYPRPFHMATMSVAHVFGFVGPTPTTTLLQLWLEAWPYAQWPTGPSGEFFLRPDNVFVGANWYEQPCAGALQQFNGGPEQRTDFIQWDNTVETRKGSINATTRHSYAAESKVGAWQTNWSASVQAIPIEPCQESAGGANAAMIESFMAAGLRPGCCG